MMKKKKNNYYISRNKLILKKIKIKELMKI